MLTLQLFELGGLPVISEKFCRSQNPLMEKRQLAFQIIRNDSLAAPSLHVLLFVW